MPYPPTVECRRSRSSGVSLDRSSVDGCQKCGCRRSCDKLPGDGIGVLAEVGRALLAVKALPVDANWATGGPVSCPVPTPNRLYHAQHLEAVVLEKSLPVQHVGAPDVGWFEDGQPVRGGAGLEVTGEDRFDAVAFGEPASRILVVEEWLTAEQFAQLGDASHGQCYVSVARAVHAVGRTEVRMGVVRCGALRWPATVVEVSGDRLELKVEHRFEHAHVHQSALVGDRTANKACENTLHQVHSAEDVGDRQSHRHRSLAGITAEPSQTREGLQQQVLPRQIAPWAFLPVAADLPVHQFRVELAHTCVGQLEPADDTWTEVVHDHVRLADELLHLFPSLRCLEVRGEALFVAVDRVENGRLTIEAHVRHIQTSAEIAGNGLLDFDHSRPEVRQPQARARTREELAQVDYQDTVERSHSISILNHFFCTWSCQFSGWRYFTVCRCSQ